MLAQLKGAVKYVLGTDIADEHFTVFPDDVFLVSYPRSGNTWIRFLLANLVYPNEKVEFTNIGRLVADPARSSRRFLRNLPRPRVLKSHHPFDVRYRKVIYVARDPRDVVVSEYYLTLKKKRIDPTTSLDQFVELFLAGQSSGYGSWWESAASWIAARNGERSFLLIRYEDLLNDTLHEISRMANFLGIDADTTRLQAAVVRSSFESMRRLEQEQADQWVGTKDTRKDIPFVRAAKAGGWREALSPQAAERIVAAWAPLIAFLGYEASEPSARMAENKPRFNEGREDQDACAPAVLRAGTERKWVPLLRKNSAE